MEKSKHRPQIAMPNPDKKSTESVPMKPKKVFRNRYSSPLWELFTKVSDMYAQCNTCKCLKRWKSIGGFPCMGSLSRHYLRAHSDKNQNLDAFEGGTNAVVSVEMANSEHQPRLAMPNSQKGSTESVPMEPKKVSKKRKARSRMWDIFSKLDERYAECDICKLRLMWRSRSGLSMVGNLSKHYSSKHANMNQNLDAFEGETNAVDSVEMGNSKHQPRIAMPNPQKRSTESVSMEPKHVPKKRKARSHMWSLFTKLDESYAECDICKLRVRWKSNSGVSMVCNLHNHYSSKHSKMNRGNGVDCNKETEEYKDVYEDQEIPTPEPPLKKQKTASSSSTRSLNGFSSRKKPKNIAVRSKLGLQPRFGALKSKKAVYSRSWRRKLSNARTKGSGQKFKLGGGDKNENLAFKTKVELKKLTVQDLVQAKVKPKVIEDYFGNVKLPAKPSSKAPQKRVAKAKETPYQVKSDLPVPMIERKDDIKPKLLNTYNNIKTQGDMIEAMIKDALPTLQGDKVSEIYNFLVDLGVENVEDLAYLEVEDMNKVLKPIQSRKLLAIWKNKGLPSQFQNQTNVPEPATFAPAVFQNQNPESNYPQTKIVKPKKIPAPQRKNTPKPSVNDVYPKHASKPKIKAETMKCETPLPLPAPKDWTETFEIPWHKLPPEIMKCLSKKKRPNRTERFQIIHTIADDIFQVASNPTLFQMGKITKEMMQKFPQSLCDEGSKKECKKLVTQLCNRIKYLRKDDGKVSDLSEDDEQTESPKPNSTTTKLKSSLTLEGDSSTMSNPKPLNTSVAQSNNLASSGRALRTTSSSGEFEIPWHKMPKTILDTLNKNKLLTKLEKDTLIAIVVDQYILWNPEQKNIVSTTREIAKQMCEIYPLSLSDKAFGIDGGGQYASAALQQFIHTRVYNIRRDFKKKKHPFYELAFGKEISPSNNSDTSFHASMKTDTKCSDSQCLPVNDCASPTKSTRGEFTKEISPSSNSDKCLRASRKSDTKRSNSQCLSVSACASPTKSPRGEFTIRWHKLDKALLEALNKNQQLTPAQSSDLVLAVCEEILRRNPGALTIAKIAVQLCEKYPSSLSNAALGSVDDGNPGSVLSGMLRSNLCDLRRTRKRKSWSSVDKNCEMPESLSEEISNMALVPCPTEEEKSSPVRLDFGDFYIPWQKFDPSLLDFLTACKQLSKEDKFSLVNIICEEIFELQPKGEHIQSYQCSKELAKKLVQLYPKSLSNPALGRKGAADSWSCLCDCFRHKLNQLKKDSSKPKSKLKAKVIQPTVGNHNHQCFCDDCPFKSFEWAFNFKIPWAKMPQELQEGLKKNELLSPTLRSELVHVVSGDILTVEENPNKECVDYIAEKICSMYPKSLCNLSGKVIGNEHEFLGQEILFRIHRMNNVKISVEEIKENKSVDSQKNSMPVDEELLENTLIAEVPMDFDSNDSPNPTGCSSIKDSIYNSSSRVLELSPSNGSSTRQDADNCANSSATNTCNSNCTTSPKNEGKQVKNDNTKSGIYSENVVPNDNMKSNIYSDNGMKDSEAKSAAKDGADSNEKSVMDPIPDNITKSKIYLDNASTECGIKSEAITTIAVPLCIVQSNGTKLVSGSDLKSIYPDIVECCDIKSEAITTKEVLDCCEKAVTDLTKVIAHNNAESVTDLTIGEDSNVKSKLYPDNVSAVSGVKSPNPKETSSIIIKSTVSIQEKNPSSNLINAEFPPETDSGVTNNSTNSVADTNIVGLNYNATPAINTASDDFSKQIRTYQSNVVSYRSSKSVTYQTDIVSEGNTKPMTFQENLVPDCNSMVLPSSMNSNYNPAPLTYPINMVPNCTPPMNTVVQPTSGTMQNYSPNMSTVIQPNPMHNFSPNMNMVMQPNPMAYTPVMVPNYNTNPATCWPPPVMAPNYLTHPMAYPSNIAQNCNNNDVIYMGNFGANQMTYPVNMNPVGNYSGVNTGTYQQVASNSLAYNHGYTMPIQYYQNARQTAKTEESEPDQRTSQPMQD